MAQHTEKWFVKREAQQGKGMGEPPSEEELLPDLCLPSGELPVSFPTPDSLWDLPLGAHSPLSRDGS